MWQEIDAFQKLKGGELVTFLILFSFLDCCLWYLGMLWGFVFIGCFGILMFYTRIAQIEYESDIETEAFLKEV